MKYQKQVRSSRTTDAYKSLTAAQTQILSLLNAKGDNPTANKLKSEVNSLFIQLESIVDLATDEINSSSKYVKNVADDGFEDEDMD